MIWLGQLRATDDRIGLVNRHIHQLAVTVASTRRFVRISDLADLLQTGESKAERCLVADGVHLTVPCLNEAASKLAPQL